MGMFIAMLRGINVSGQKLIKMKLLQEMLEELHFENVKTYLQSGNVVFSTKEKDCFKMQAAISLAIKNKFGFDVPVIVLTAAHLETIINKNPFSNRQSKKPEFFHVTFFSGVPALCNLEDVLMKKSVDEDVEFITDAAYLYCPNGYGQTKLTNTFLESKLKTTATTRNWNTVNALLKLATT